MEKSKITRDFVEHLLQTCMFMNGSSLFGRSEEDWKAMEKLMVKYADALMFIIEHGNMEKEIVENKDSSIRNLLMALQM